MRHPVAGPLDSFGAAKIAFQRGEALQSQTQIRPDRGARRTDGHSASLRASLVVGSCATGGGDVRPRRNRQYIGGRMVRPQLRLQELMSRQPTNRRSAIEQRSAGMPPLGRLSGAERTRFARFEFFAFWPRLRENAKTLERGRTSYSFKTSLGAHTVSPFNFAIEAENIILLALRVFEFSHSLDPYATSPSLNRAPGNLEYLRARITPP
jgi:hypothetical protein